MRFFLKILISALVIASVSEIGKRSSMMAALLASLPLTTLLAISWLYLDTRDATKAAELSQNIFWLIQPSFIFLLGFPWLIKLGYRFEIAMTASLIGMMFGYAVYAWALRKFGIQSL